MNRLLFALVLALFVLFPRTGFSEKPEPLPKSSEFTPYLEEEPVEDDFWDEWDEEEETGAGQEDETIVFDEGFGKETISPE